VDVLLDDLGITSSEKAAGLVGYPCGLLIGLAQLHAARTGESWEDLLTQFGKVAISEQWRSWAIRSQDAEGGARRDAAGSELSYWGDTGSPRRTASRAV
jgi:hypothetical protein